MQYLSSKLHQLFQSDLVRRVFHTFWQAAAGTLLAGLAVAKSSADVKLALAAALTVGLAAVKAAVISKNQ